MKAATALALAAATGRHREITLTLPRLFPWQEKASKLALEPDTRVLVLNLGRQAGKTTWGSDLIGNAALDKKINQLWVAPTNDLSRIGRETFLHLFRPVLADYEETNRRATLLNGSVVLWRSADNPDSLIGGTYHRVFVEEASRVSDDALERALVPTLTTTRGQLVAISTPRGTRGWFYKFAGRARDGAAGYSYLHGPSTENTNPAVREYVDLMRRELPELIFKQEFLAEFISGAGAVFRGLNGAEIATVCTSALAEPQPGRRYVVGVDLARKTDYVVLAVMDLDSGAFGPLDRFNRISWPQIRQRVADFARRWNRAVVYADATGVGDAVVDEIATESGLDIRPVVITSDVKSRLVVGLSSAMENGVIALPDDDGLRSELEAFGYEVLPTGRYRYEATSGHDDRVIATALAVHGRHSEREKIPLFVRSLEAMAATGGINANA